ncbi:MAG: hypothetical protein ABJA71_00560 [Ginsengibacter sp.]
MKRFLIVQHGCYGDCLFATTIARQIKNDYQDSHITWAVSTSYKSILQHNPFIDSLWEITINGNYFDKKWRQFEKEVVLKKETGEFDEIIFSQVLPYNWEHFSGTIRHTILSSYKKPITVFVAPVLHLTQQEILNVKHFAESNNLSEYKEVILVECNPGSGQSKMNMDFAVNLAGGYADQKEICFVISTHKPLPKKVDRIIDASLLSFRENAELTKYCTLLIGCSSGITWLATSNAARQLPMIQLLDKRYELFAGVSYDHQLWGLNNNHILERVNYNEATAKEIVDCFLQKGIVAAKEKYHEVYRPSYKNFAFVIKSLLKKESASKAYNLIGLWAGLHTHLSEKKLKQIFNTKYLTVVPKKIIKNTFKKVISFFTKKN